MNERTPQDQDKYVVRFPDGMRDKLKSAASENMRSMNAEIVARLERTFAIEESNRRRAAAYARGENPLEDVPPPTDPSEYGIPLDVTPSEFEIDVATQLRLLELAASTISERVQELVRQLEKEGWPNT